MPVISVECGQISKEKKALLVKALVSASSDILDLPEEAFVTLIRENDPDNVGSGTKLLSDSLGK